MIDRVCRWIGLGVAGSGLLLATGAALRLIMFDGGDNEGMLLGLGLGFLTGGIWILAAVSVVDRPAATRAARMAVLATLVALGFLGALAASALRQSESAAWMPTATSIAAIVALAAMFLAILRAQTPTSSSARFARGATIAMVWLVAISSVSLILLFDLLPEPVRSIGVRSILGGVVVAALCGSTTYHLLAAERRARLRLGETVSPEILVELECPRCDAPRKARPGVWACKACGYVVSIAVEEPRCVCGYQLFRLQGDTCPECGRPVGVGAVT